MMATVAKSPTKEFNHISSDSSLGNPLDIFAAAAIALRSPKKFRNMLSVDSSADMHANNCSSPNNDDSLNELSEHQIASILQSFKQSSENSKEGSKECSDDEGAKEAHYRQAQRNYSALVVAAAANAAEGDAAKPVKRNRKPRKKAPKSYTEEEHFEDNLMDGGQSPISSTSSSAGSHSKCDHGEGDSSSSSLMNTDLPALPPLPKLNGMYPCPLDGCDRSFSRRYNLKTHIYTHYNVRQFRCDWKDHRTGSVCGKVFTRRFDLRRHGRVHGLALTESEDPSSSSTAQFKTIDGVVVLVNIKADEDTSFEDAENFIAMIENVSNTNTPGNDTKPLRQSTNQCSAIALPRCASVPIPSSFASPNVDAAAFGLPVLKTKIKSVESPVNNAKLLVPQIEQNAPHVATDDNSPVLTQESLTAMITILQKAGMSVTPAASESVPSAGKRDASEMEGGLEQQDAEAHKRVKTA